MKLYEVEYEFKTELKEREKIKFLKRTLKKYKYKFSIGTIIIYNKKNEDKYCVVFFGDIPEYDLNILIDLSFDVSNPDFLFGKYEKHKILILSICSFLIQFKLIKNLLLKIMGTKSLNKFKTI